MKARKVVDPITDRLEALDSICRQAQQTDPALAKTVKADMLKLNVKLH